MHWGFYELTLEDWDDEFFETPAPCYDMHWGFYELTNGENWDYDHLENPAPYYNMHRGVYEVAGVHYDENGGDGDTDSGFGDEVGEDE